MRSFIRYSSAMGTTLSWAAIWRTLSAEVYTMGCPVAMCAGPSLSMTAVPDATTLPKVGRPIRASMSAITAGGKPVGNVGNGVERTMPAISQWPVTESLPGEASAIRPKAPRIGGDGPEFSRATRPSPSDRSWGTASGTVRAMLPTVSLPSSP